MNCLYQTDTWLVHQTERRAKSNKRMNKSCMVNACQRQWRAGHRNAKSELSEYFKLTSDMY